MGLCCEGCVVRAVWWGCVPLCVRFRGSTVESVLGSRATAERLQIVGRVSAGDHAPCCSANLLAWGGLIQADTDDQRFCR